jgi:hypothetical protein
MRRIVLTTIIGFSVLAASAQKKGKKKLHKEVEVSKAYRPTVNNAQKLNFTPTDKDTAQYKPTFNYSIKSNPVESTHDITPLTATKVNTNQTETLGLGYAKLGMGNYTTPYAELFVNKRQSKTTSFGMHFKHLSSNGKVELENGTKVKAPYSHNFFNVFTQHYGRKTDWGIDLLYDRNRITYYGFAGKSDIPTKDNGEFQNWLQNQKQVFEKIQAKFDLSSRAKKSKVDYDIAFKASHFSATTDQKELFLGADYNVKKAFKPVTLWIDGSLFMADTKNIIQGANTSYMTAPAEALLSDHNEVFFKLNPTAYWAGDNWKFRLGFNTDFIFEKDKDAEVKIAPKMYGEWTPIEDILTIFIQTEGGTSPQLYSNSFQENPYRDSYELMKNKFITYEFKGGFNGNFSKSTSFSVYALYSQINNEPFYNMMWGGEKALILPASNTFKVMYDDADLFQLHGEVMHNASKTVNFLLKGNYYSWKMKNMDEPFGKPKFDATFTSTIYYDSKLTFNADLFVEGGRKYWYYNSEEVPGSSGFQQVANRQTITTDPVIDLSVGAQYKYTDQWHFWARANNLLFRRHERYVGYAEQRFMLMLGVGYSF